MQTQCPRCEAFMEIDDEALQRSRRMVDCPHCSVRFYAQRRQGHGPTSNTDAARSDNPAQTPTVAAEDEGTESGRLFGSTAPQAPASDENGEEWLVNLPTNLAAALIAKAAGIPPEAQRDEPAWWVTADTPEQGPDTELDNTPEAPAKCPAIELESGDLPGQRADIAPAGATITDGSGGKVPVPPPDTEADAPPQTSAKAHLGPIATDAPETPAADTDHDGDATVSTTGMPAATSAEPVPEPAPVYVRPPRRWASRASLSWALGCLLLALLLAAQLAWIKRVALYNNLHTRPWVAQVCQYMPCHLPPIRDIAKLQLLSRDVRPDPDKHGALIITASVRNDADIAQPWPTVTVQLSDLGGNPVAMRRFRPDHYMPNPARRAAGIAAGATAVLAFEVADPGPRAVSFRFGLQ